jgi:hypothetical protein
MFPFTLPIQAQLAHLKFLAVHTPALQSLGILLQVVQLPTQAHYQSTCQHQPQLLISESGRLQLPVLITSAALFRHRSQLEQLLEQ